MAASVSQLLHQTVVWRVVVAALIIGGRLYAEQFVPRGRPPYRRRRDALGSRSRRRSS